MDDNGFDLSSLIAGIVLLAISFGPVIIFKEQFSEERKAGQVAKKDEDINKKITACENELGKTHMNTLSIQFLTKLQLL